MIPSWACLLALRCMVFCLLLRVPTLHSLWDWQALRSSFYQEITTVPLAMIFYHAREWSYHPGIHAPCWVAAGLGVGMANGHMHFHLILLHCWNASIMKKRLSEERSNCVLVLTREAIPHRGQRTPLAVCSKSISLHREAEVMPESFLTNQLGMSPGKSLNLCDSVFCHPEAIIIPTLSSSIC